MGGKERSMSPILPVADEEGLDRDRSGLASQGKHIGITEPLGMYRLASLDVGQRAQPVAIDGGELIILLLGGFGHRPRQPRLDSGRPAGEEFLRLPDQLAIILIADAADARSRAALDLVEQAGSRAVLEIAVRTAS